MPDRLLAPLPTELRDGIAFDDHGDRLVLRATADLDDLAGRRFAEPTVGVRLRATDAAPDIAAGISLLGFAYTQFALPVRARPGSTFDFRPAPNLRSPAAVMPLLATSPDGRVELLAPLDAWHEQIIAVEPTTDAAEPSINRLTWGWHGDLESVPADFRATLGIFTGTSAAEVFHQWGAAVQAARTERQRPTDSLLTHLSYWTDNGAAYWYRTEAGLDITATLRTKLDELDTLGVSVRSLELDSWFYPHEISRSVSETGYLEEVPPTGMLSWTPRPEVLPDGVEGIRSAAGDRPLVLHSRHISPSSPYVDRGEWWIDHTAQPVDPSFFDRWFRDASRWGATCVEQDWMMVSFFGNRELRARPGRTMAWQQGLDEAASSHGLSLLWCMALPGDFAAAVELDRVIAVRTCDDYRFAADPAVLWVWYLTVNTLAAALGLPVFKDCFFSSPEVGAEAIDGDANAELEALLSAMSAGVVGIGDRIGRTDAAIISRVCRPDGRLIGPDQPITLTDQSMAGAGLDGGLCWASTSTTNRLGTWRYVLAINTSPTPATIEDRLLLDETMLVFSWRDRTAAVRAEVDAALAPRDWALFVCCPIVDIADGHSALIGDPDVYATMGPTRVDVDGDRPTMITAEGEAGRPLLWWSADGGLHSDRRV